MVSISHKVIAVLRTRTGISETFPAAEVSIRKHKAYTKKPWSFFQRGTRKLF